MAEKWIVVGAPTLLDTIEHDGVLLNRTSPAFTPIKNQKFKKALESGKVAQVKVQRKPLVTKKELYEKRVKSLQAKAKLEKKVEKKVVKQVEAPQKAPVDVIMQLGLSKKIATKLVDAGFVTVDDLRGAEDEELLEVSGIGESTVAHIREALEG
jgi:NAD-dependent DNA ligase